MFHAPRGSIRKSLWMSLGGAAALMVGTSASAQAAQATPGWKFEFVPYFWAPALKGDAKVLDGLVTRDVDISSTSILKNLRWGLMGTLEARNGPWGVVLDGQAVELGIGRQSAYGLLGGYEVRFQEQIWTVAGKYRLYESPAAEVDLVGGARYIGAKTSITFDPSIYGLGRTVKAREGWWNGIVGASAKVPITDKWSLLGYVDVGSGGSNDTSWQALAGASYQYSPTTSFKFGYRYLTFTRDQNKTLDEASLGGVYLGAGFKF
ncbi:MAG: hypothetical protein ABWZ88_14585 [Variovorax sp.]